MKRNFALLMTMSLLLPALSACGPRHEHAQSGALIGGAVGAGTGAAVGSASDNVGAGALTGAAVGATAGAIIGDVRDKAEITTKEQDSFIARQKREMQKQERELDDLRRQKFHDDYFRSEYEQGRK